jgi:replicative DNA helicase
MERLHNAPIFIDEAGALNSLELRTRARRMRRQCGKLGLIMVDYLQLMSAADTGPGREPRHRDLRDLARPEGARQGARGAGGGAVAAQPGARDAQRQAADDVGPARVGAIEQDADVILFIYRDEVYFPDKEERRAAPR